MTDLASRLRAVVERAGADGKPVYARDQVAHLVPFLLFAGAPAVKSALLPDAVARHLGTLGAALGLKPGVSPDKLAAAMAAYYVRFPVHPALLADVTAAFGQDWAAAAAATLALLSMPDAPAWLPTMEPVKPKVAAGPLARTALGNVKDKQSR